MSEEVHAISLATASNKALMSGPELSKQDSTGSKGADSKDSAAFFSFGLHISILSPIRLKVI